MILAGIDLGGRTTSKTSITLLTVPEMSVRIYTAAEVGKIINGKDRKFIVLLRNLAADILGIDAPLSLPDTTSPDYLYRPCDKTVNALSPFTIGEITARAMYLNSQMGGVMYEVYPKSLLKLHNLPYTRYKNDLIKISKIALFATEYYNLKNVPEITTGDDLDSLLCALILYHKIAGKFKCINESEGFILPT